MPGSRITQPAVGFNFTTGRVANGEAEVEKRVTASSWLVDQRLNSWLRKEFLIFMRPAAR